MITCNSLFPFPEAMALKKTVTFSVEQIVHDVFEGDTINLVCELPLDNVGRCKIHTVETLLVDAGRPVEGLSNDFKFSRSDTTCELKIMQVNRTHSDTYWCRYPVKSAVMKVMYNPKEGPSCISNYDSNEYFADPFSPFEFNCSSNEGDPAINISISVVGSDEGITSQVLDEQVTVNRNTESVVLSYSPYLDSSFSNSEIYCSVTQHLPAPYQSYRRNCSSGRLTLLPTFSLSVEPDQYTFKIDKRENINITCSSNVTDVSVEWIVNNTDSGLQYSIKSINNTSVLHIWYTGSSEMKSFSAQCKGSYGGKFKFQNVLIHFEESVNSSEQNSAYLLTSLVFVILKSIYLTLA